MSTTSAEGPADKARLHIRFGDDGIDFLILVIYGSENREAARVGLGTIWESFSMCDYSLHNVKSRPAKVGEKLKIRLFNLGTRGFSAPEDINMAVCVLPGTELAFATAVRCSPRGLLGWKLMPVD